MWLLPILIVGTTVLLSIPMSWYLAGIIDGKFRAPRPLLWVERQLDTGPQNWKQYAFSLMLFNTVMFLFGYALLAFQPDLPMNQKDSVFPEGKSMLSPTTIVNTAISFLTNTNLQHYSGEVHLSYFSQIFEIGRASCRERVSPSV